MARGWPEGLRTKGGLPGGSTGKNPPTMQEMQETQVRFLVQEDALEKEMAPHSSILAWEMPWTEEPGTLQATGCEVTKELGMT